MMYRKIDCPVCGNEITVKKMRGAQKCPYCKRFFEVEVTKIRNKKYIFNAKELDVIVTYKGLEDDR